MLKRKSKMPLTTCDLKKKKEFGQPGWLSDLAPPLAQGVILETQDQVPHQAPCMEPASASASTVSLHLSLSLSLSLSLCLSWINK